jgi:hypothetical protein
MSWPNPRLRAWGVYRSLFFRVFARGAALATTWGVLVCAQAGCLIPQTVDPIVALPHVPPQFVPESMPSYLLPRVLTLFVQGASDTPPCHCQLLFDQLTVQEEDSTVTLEARWFIDYDPSNLPSTRVALSYQIAPNFDDVTQTIRPLQPFAFDAAAAGIVSSGLHVVEVVVGETTGFDPSSTALPNRAMKPGYAAATFKFVVDVHLEQIPGNCPATPPSHPVCQ